MAISFGTGISVPIKGSRYWNQYWEPSYMVNAGLFTYLNSNILFGVRGAYNSWVVNPNEVTKNYSSMVAWGTVKGNSTIIEVSPTIRFITSDEYNKTNLFLQIGVGYYWIKGNYNFNGTYQHDDNAPLVYYSGSNSYKMNMPGFSLGYGLKGGRFEILPLYNVIFTNQDPTHYVSVNLNLNF